MTEREIEALCTNYKYQEIIDDIPNPETPEKFAQRMVNEYIQNNVIAYEHNLIIEKVEQDYKDDPEGTVARAKIK